MTTTKSYSDKGRIGSLFLSSIKRMLPFAMITMILIFLMVPLVFFAAPPSHLANMDQNLAITQAPEDMAANITAYYVRQFSYGVYKDDVQSVLVTLALMAIAIAAAIYNGSYAQSKKQTDFYHSLPVKRCRLLSVNALASATTILVPFLLMALVTFVGQMAMFGRYGCFGSAYFTYLFTDIAIQVTSVFVVYFFTTFISVQVGTIFDTLALTGSIGLLPLGVYGISFAFWASFTYGANMESLQRSLLLSPFTFTFDRYTAVSYGPNGNVFDYKSIWLTLAVWAVIGVVLYLASIALYNRRKSEVAEQTQPTGVLQLIAKFFAAFCGAALLLMIFSDRSIPVRLLATFAGAMLIGIIAELILSRGLRFLRKNLRWIAIAGGAYCILTLVVFFDLSGYVARVPASQDVQSVAINYMGRVEQQIRYNDNLLVELTDPASIAIVTDMHNTAVQRYKATDNKRNLYNEPGWSYQYVTLNYQLKNGKTLSRTYSPMALDAYLKLVDLEAQDDFIRAASPVFSIDPGAVTGVTVNSRIAVSPGYILNPSADEAEKLLYALQQDLLAEPLNEIVSPSQPAVGYVTIRYRVPPEENRPMYYDKYDEPYIQLCEVLVTPQYTNTLAWLQANDVKQYTDLPGPVEQIFLIPNMSFNSYDNRVSTIGATGGYWSDTPYVADYIKQYLETGSVDEYANFEYAIVDSAAEINQVLEDCRNQTLTIREMDGTSSNAASYVLAFAIVDGKVSTYSYLPVEDVPASAKATIQNFIDLANTANDKELEMVATYPVAAPRQY